MELKGRFSRGVGAAVVIIYACLLGLATAVVKITSKYPDGAAESVSWNNLAVDPGTGAIYAGGVNRLFRFDANLSVVDQTTTGPVLDSPLCYSNFNSSPCLGIADENRDSYPTNNNNRVLLVDTKHRQLVTCGSVFQGTCQTRSLSNISNSTYYSWPLSQYIVVVSRSYPTVAFIGPGPFGDDVLYVGTYTEGSSSNEWLRTKFLAGVSSRNLTQPGTFLVTEFDDMISYGTRAYVMKEVASKYRVNYVAGFSQNGFSYFLTTQPEPFSLSSTSSTMTSKIVQVCQNDPYYDSYVEMRIVCSSGGVDYNLIQAGVFVQPGAELAKALKLTVDDFVFFGLFSTADQGSFGSAICVFPLSVIRQRFTQNIQKCYDDPNTLVGPQFYQTGRSCSTLRVNISDSYCGNLFMTLSRSSLRNSPLVGTIALVSQAPALTLPQVNVTAVNAMTVDNHTVLFLGSADGRLLKVLLDNATNGTVYENSPVGRSAVNQDLLLNTQKSHLYMMTSETIFKIPVSNCEQYTTCGTCLAARDPFCGWCFYENGCTRRSDCPDNQLSNRWMSIYSQANPICPLINISPRSIDVNANVNVAVNVTILADLKTGEYYTCKFGSSSSSRASVVGNQIVCPVPTSGVVLPSGQDNVVVDLLVQKSGSSAFFVQTNVTFYDCNFHTVCSSCARAQWGCQWCIFANRCQNETSSCVYDSSVQDVQLCPSLPADSKELLVPAGIETAISLAAKNLPVPQANEKGYSCEISSPSLQQPLVIQGRRLSSSLINCSAYSFKNDGKQPYFSASLRVTWGNGNIPIEGSYNITVFDCGVMADGDCNRCLSLQYALTTKFGCQWCGTKCQSNVSTCDATSSGDSVCPRALVTSVVPLSGPKEGGTRVTISGNNLGYQFDKVNAYMGNDACVGIPDEYVISERYVCVTRGVQSAGPCNLTVVVSSVPANQDSVLRTFSFMDPEVNDVKPKSGPKAGGTPVTIYGRDLNTGSNTSVSIGQQPCVIDRSRSNANELVCITTSSNITFIMMNVAIQFDNAVRFLSKEFQYVENPVFTNPVPDGSFKTGGCTINVPAANLDSVSSISLKLSYNNAIIPVNVSYRNASVFQFRSPMVSGFNGGDSGLKYDLLMQLDGLQHKLPFVIYPDPYVERFAGGSRPYGGDTIQITGRNMMVPCMGNSESEVLVYVGTQLCNISSLTDTNLYCKPPNKAPDGATKAKVTVTVGSSLIFDLGDLVYQVDESSILWPIIVGVIGGVLVIIIVVLIFIFCVMSSRNERQYGKLQAQMEALESGVRNECKQAFTELQTDVSDFTSDISTIGIPFWDYRMYAFKLLFPMVLNHQVLYINTLNGRRYGEFSDKMHRFNQLLSHKQFLLTFIHTMEKQPQDFGITDRSKVASLLSVVLMDKMDYATEIIKILLDELIVKSLEKRAPKLMLRRAETVVEKLLANWLSLSMYGYLKSNTGRALFMLYKAIKHQTEKGPIDAATAEAKYSLSEDRLLREKIEPKTLNVMVYEAENTAQPPITCKLLDCDTITQAKEKALDAIYKNTPFSKRPSRNSIDLRWNAGKSVDGYAIDPRDFLPLNDQDVTTEVVDGWKRINSLSHYHIKDGSTFQLQKNSRSEPVHLVHGKIELETGTLLHTIRLEEGAKVWHLVKHDDAANNVSKTQKVISEIFLTRLLQTKMTLQQYIDDLFKAILKADESLPLTVKYLYDFLDSAAQCHGITDSEVVHAWKSNSLPLRFWVNLIKNPEFLFDINKSPVVDCCLSVIAQTFMDSCSTHEHRLGKDSPSAKLLFAKDIPRYRQLVSQFYQRIQDMPPVTDDMMKTAMAELSNIHSADFNQEVALYELYDYALRFSPELLVALENEPSARKLRLAEHFEQLRLLRDENLNNSTV